MKRIVLVVLMLLATSLLAQAKPTAALRLDNGMPLIVSPVSDVSSVVNKTGDAVTFTVVHDCKVDGTVLVAAGTTVQAVISDAQHSKMFGRPGLIEVTFLTTTAVDGSTLRVRASMDPQEDLNAALDAKGNQEKKGPDKAAQFLPYGLGFVFNGKEAVLKAGTPLTIFTDEDVDFAIAPGAAPKRTTPQPTTGP